MAEKKEEKQTSVHLHVGQIISYNDGVEDKAAIVTQIVDDNHANLFVFNDPGRDGVEVSLGKVGRFVLNYEF